MHRHMALLMLGLGLLCSGCMVPGPLSVMSFNIRYATDSDGDNAWPHRRDQVVKLIKERQPEILAMQEVLCSQAKELRGALGEYGFVGVGRDDGAEAGEMVPIMFLERRFTLVDHGHFWLSPTPEQVGSKGWDAALPRMATWVRLRFNDAPFRELRVINVHFDHRGKQARIESAKLLRKVVEAWGGRPTLVCGDFNAVPGSKPYQILCGDEKDPYVLFDAHACAGVADTAGTYHGFTGQAGRSRIDWVLFNKRFKALDADIDRSADGNRYPSDHFPVSATLQIALASGAGFT
jgi:endonuclease/exonuclease/phosphatase family metal-dependent hydrolase